MKKNRKDLIIKELEKTPIVSVVCKKVGVSRNTYYKWLQNDKEFLEKVSKAQFMGINIVSDAAESNVVQGIRNKDPGMTKYWLSHRHHAYKKPFTHRNDLLDLVVKEQQEKIHEIQNRLKSTGTYYSDEEMLEAEKEVDEWMSMWDEEKNTNKD